MNVEEIIPDFVDIEVRSKESDKTDGTVYKLFIRTDSKRIGGEICVPTEYSDKEMDVIYQELEILVKDIVSEAMEYNAEQQKS